MADVKKLAEEIVGLTLLEAVELKNINFSQIHANIFYTLDPLLRKDKTVDIVNIDDHHDIVGYCPTMNNAYNSANWLGYYLNKPNFVLFEIFFIFDNAPLILKEPVI